MFIPLLTIQQENHPNIYTDLLQQGEMDDNFMKLSPLTSATSSIEWI